MSATVHTVAQTGFGAGTNELYDSARPSYQPNALSYIRSIVKDKASLDIVEIGAGTGIFTRALLAHPEWQNSVKRLRAVEPSGGMRDQFSKTVKDERVTIQDGTFDTTGIEDGSADIIIIAQAFHWCPDYDLAMAEFSRILKPDGVAVCIWNLENRDAARWVAELRNRIEQYEQDTPQFRLGLWRKAFDTPSYQKFFQPHVEKVWGYHLTGTADLVVNRAHSKSYIAVLSQEQKAELEKDVRAILEKGEDLKWIDKDAGSFEYPYETFVVVAAKK